MTTSNTFGIVFYIKRQKAKNGKAPIYARITVDGKRVELSLKMDVDIEINWNDAKGMAKGKSEEIRSLNTYLEQVRFRLVECYQHLQLKKKLITAEAIKAQFCGGEEKEHSLLNVIDYHNTEMKSTLEWGTQKNYYTTRKYVEMFLKKKLRTSDIYLSQLNYKFITDFEKFMKEYQPLDHHKPCGQNTVMKHIERLRKVVNLAIKNDWLEKDPFHKFSPHFIKSTREFLSAEELNTIEVKDFKIFRLQQVKDLFVFSCYTGLAYIDVMRLTTQNITIGIDGNYWLYTNRKKTEESVRVPLLPKALEIIEKYKKHPAVIQSGGILPRMSNQKLNSYLKEVADLSGIDKNLTFHLARHTFATTVTLTNGVPIETVSKLLGHTSIRTTQIYAKVIERKVSDDMNLLKTKLNQQPTLKVMNN
jgi:site-specific recombinase XerD